MGRAFGRLINGRKKEISASRNPGGGQACSPLRAAVPERTQPLQGGNSSPAVDGKTPEGKVLKVCRETYDQEVKRHKSFLI